MKTHKNLDVWKKSIEMVTIIYSITRNFPKEELYALTNQIRRAAVSVPSNIAEGSGRNSTKELLQFLHYATGSLAELETQIIIAHNLKYLNDEQTQNVNVMFSDIFKMLSRFMQSLKEKS